MAITNVFNRFKVKKPAVVTPENKVITTSVGNAPKSILNQYSQRETSVGNAPKSIMDRYTPKKAPNIGESYLTNVVKGNEQPINIEASFAPGDRTLARQADTMRAQTGAAIAKADQLGQGAAIREGQRTEQNIMANLTTRESEKALARVNEEKSNQARRDSAAQILANYGLNRDQLDLQVKGQEADIRFKEAGIDQDNWNRMWELSQGMPETMSMLIKQQLDKSGVPYDPEMIDRDIAAKAEADKLDPETQILNNLALATANMAETTANAGKVAEPPTAKTIKSMNINDWMSKTPDEITALSKSPGVITVDDFNKSMKRESDFKQNYNYKKGDIIFYQGKPYAFKEFKSEKYNKKIKHGGGAQESRRKSQMIFTDLSTGKEFIPRVQDESI